jgi:hypothetical protein
VVENKDGTQADVACPACGGCGSKHAGVPRAQLEREGYYDRGGW